MSLANIRKLLRMTQNDLANKLGYEVSTIRMIEQGHRAPYKTIYAIADVLGCEVSAIIKSDDEPFGEDEIIAVPSVAMKHIGRPCFFGNTVAEVMNNAEQRKNCLLVDAKEGAMLDSNGNEWRYILPNRKFEAQNLPRNRTGRPKKKKEELQHAED